MAQVGLLVGRAGVGEEVGGDQAADAVHLAHVEAVLVHVAVHVDDLAGAKGQLHLRAKKEWLNPKKLPSFNQQHSSYLRVKVGRQLLRVVVVEGDHLADGQVVPRVIWVVPKARVILHVVLHLGDHVAGDEADAAVRLAAVEAVGVLVAENLKRRGKNNINDPT